MAAPEVHAHAEGFQLEIAKLFLHHFSDLALEVVSVEGLFMCGLMLGVGPPGGNMLKVLLDDVFHRLLSLPLFPLPADAADGGARLGMELAAPQEDIQGG